MRHLFPAALSEGHVTLVALGRAKLGKFIATVFLVATLHAQTPSFEAATIKPASALKREPAMHSDPGRLAYANVSLRDCLAAAYGLKPYQVQGPAYIGEGAFDIVATTAEATPEDQKMLMLRTLLTDRFRVQLHHETRDLPVYVIGRGKGKPKLHESTSTKPVNRYEDGAFVFEGITLAEFASGLAKMRVDRPVLDRTGLTGRYDLRLEFDNEFSAVKRSMMNGTFSSDLGAAIQTQLGLKWESTKAPVEMLIVDQAEKVPSDN